MTTPDHSLAYRPDLAYIHDAGYGGLARGAAATLVRQLRQAGIPGGRVVDLGCGSGILSEQVAAAGYEVLGIDLSSAMIDLARRRVAQGQFRVESWLQAEIPPCVAVAAVGEVFNYRFDSGNTPATLTRVLRRIHAALAPGGFLLFDVAEPGRVPSGGPIRSHNEGDDWAVLVTAEERGLLLTRQITSFRKVGDTYRRDHEVHRLRLLPRQALAGQLRGIGFRVRLLRRYEEFAFPPGLVGFLARKP